MNTYQVTDDVREVLHESTVRNVNAFDCVGTKQIAIIEKNDKVYKKVARNVFQSLHNLSQSSCQIIRHVKPIARSHSITASENDTKENSKKGSKTYPDRKEIFREGEYSSVYSPIQVAMYRKSSEHSNATKFPKKRKVEVATMEESSKKTCYWNNSKELGSFFNDISQVKLEDERVYDSCDEVRSKISNFIDQHKLHKKVLISNLQLHGITFNNFMKSSKQEQCHSIAYKNAYIFFEKLRIYQGTQKSECRLNNEKLHPHGFSLKKKRSSAVSTTTATGEMC